MHKHIFEKVKIESIEHIENGWIVHCDTGTRIYYDYDRLNKVLSAQGNGKFQQCVLCSKILEF